MRDVEELTVINKTLDFIVWLSQRVSHFNRSHRYSLGTRIENHAHDLLELLIDAKYQRDRGNPLRKANRKIEILRLQLRIAHSLQCLSGKSYGYSAKSLDEIGRMVGGWIKRERG